jgi:hypothetical protein
MKETCANCGNEYDKPMKISVEEKEYIFDCFECAIQMMAPVCAHCETRIIGHGVEANSKMFCCAQCARSENQSGLVDRVG